MANMAVSPRPRKTGDCQMGVGGGTVRTWVAVARTPRQMTEEGSTVRGGRFDCLQKHHLLADLADQVDLALWLGRTLERRRLLYNAALEERIDCNRKAGQSINCVDKAKSLTVRHRALPDMADTAAAIQRRTLKRLDHASHGFFRRTKTCGADFPGSRGAAASTASAPVRSCRSRAAESAFRILPG